MFEIKKGNNKFYFTDESNKQIGVITYKPDNGNFVVEHTFVSPQYRSQGLAAKLVDAMVEYSREQNKKIIPVCSYVLSKFQNNEAEYGDVWERKKD